MVQRRRGFGRLRRERSGRYSAAYVGPDLRLHGAPDTFKAKIDAEGWLAMSCGPKGWSPTTDRRRAPASGTSRSRPT